MKLSYSYIINTCLMIGLLSGCAEESTISQPEAIANLKATTDIEKIVLNWDNPDVADFESYWISYMPGDELVIIDDPSNTSLILENLEAGEEYQFRLVYVTTDKVRSLPSDITATPESLFIEPQIIHEGDLLIDTQEQLDKLSLLYTKVAGKLRIRGADISDLSKLANVKEVEGNLEILDDNGSLTSLEGLNKIEKVGGNLWLRRNSALTSIEALSSLVEIEGDGGLYLYENSVLESLDGLENLMAVKNLYIGDRDGDTTDGEGNPLLSNLCALKLAIQGSPALIYIGENYYNPTVENILADVCQAVIAEGTVSLTSQADIDALPELYTHITGTLKVKGADINDLSKLSNLESVGSNLEILDVNSILTSLDGLNSLASVGGNFWLRRNPELVSIEALMSLQKIVGNLYLYENDKITSLQGLNNLMQVANMYIGDRDEDLTDGEGNPLLADLCALQNAASYESLGDFFIGENAFNPTKEEIIAGVCSQ